MGCYCRTIKLLPNQLKYPTICLPLQEHTRKNLFPQNLHYIYWSVHNRQGMQGVPSGQGLPFIVIKLRVYDLTEHPACNICNWGLEPVASQPSQELIVTRCPPHVGTKCRTQLGKRAIGVAEQLLLNPLILLQKSLNWLEKGVRPLNVGVAGVLVERVYPVRMLLLLLGEIGTGFEYLMRIMQQNQL